MNEKEQLRTEFRKKRLSLDSAEVKEKSRQIMKKLFSLEEFRAAKTIMFYVSKDNEVNTHNIIKHSLDNKVVCVPKTNLATKNIDAYSIDSFDQLSIGTFYVMEPNKGKLVDSSKIDLIFLPGLVFDKNGNRLGRGKGYYDKFLKNTKAKKIGLAFDFQVIDGVPTNKHDVSVDMIVTEKEVIDCG